MRYIETGYPETRGVPLNRDRAEATHAPRDGFLCCQPAGSHRADVPSKVPGRDMLLFRDRCSALQQSSAPGHGATFSGPRPLGQPRWRTTNSHIRNEADARKRICSSRREMSARGMRRVNRRLGSGRSQLRLNGWGHAMYFPGISISRAPQRAKPLTNRAS